MTNTDWTRYSRQMLFSPIGEEGQQKIQQSKVLIVGMGALGTVIANHLARAGVGHLVFCDRDYVEKSNLQRQMLFDEEDVAHFLPKAVAAEQKLKKINSDVKIEGHVTDINPDNIEQFIENVDLIMDGTDNFQTRYLINDVAYKYSIPFIYGGAVSSRGMNAVFIPGETPCLRCLFPTSVDAGQTCDTIGVLAPVVDIVASIQVVEALKLLSGNEKSLRNNFVNFDVWGNHSFKMNFSAQKEDCPTCKKEEYPSLTKKEGDGITTLCGRNTTQFQGVGTLDLKEWNDKLKNVSQSTKLTPFLLKVNLHEGEDLVLFPEGRVLVQGTEDITRAKSLYAKYIGM